MATAGPNSPGAAANIDNSGASLWSNVNNALAEDAAVASATVAFDESSDYLVVTSFGFAVPAGATINGIVVEFKGRESAGIISNVDVEMTKDGTAGIGGGVAAEAMTGTLAYYTLGGVADLWGTTWTVAQINASTFGVRLVVTGDGGVEVNTAEIDHVRITITYTPLPGGAGSERALMGIGS